METLRKLWAISAGLLILVFVEGMMTLGAAFDFNNYSLIGWIIQFIVVFFTVISSLLVIEESLKSKSS